MVLKIALRLVSNKLVIAPPLRQCAELDMVIKQLA
jgi:hypothetical protein